MLKVTLEDALKEIDYQLKTAELINERLFLNDYQNIPTYKEDIDDLDEKEK